MPNLQFDCLKHRPFQVSGSAVADRRTTDAEPTRWEAALAKARANFGEWPVIVMYDFGVWPAHRIAWQAR